MIMCKIGTLIDDLINLQICIKHLDQYPKKIRSSGMKKENRLQRNLRPEGNIARAG